MVKEVDLIRVEKLSYNFSQLILYVDNHIENKRVLDRYMFRAKSPFYQLLINIENEVNVLKSSTLIIPQQLIDLRRRVNGLLRLIEDTNLAKDFCITIINDIEDNIKFTS